MMSRFSRTTIQTLNRRNLEAGEHLRTCKTINLLIDLSHKILKVCSPQFKMTKSKINSCKGKLQIQVNKFLIKEQISIRQGPNQTSILISQFRKIRNLWKGYRSTRFFLVVLHHLLFCFMYLTMKLIQ